MIDEIDAIYRSTTEFPKSSDKVIEEVETEDRKTRSKSERTNGEDYESSRPRSFDPERLAKHELPKWRRYPESIPFDLQEEAGRQDIGKGSSGLMGRYVVRCMSQLITPMSGHFIRRASRSSNNMSSEKGSISRQPSPMEFSMGSTRVICLWIQPRSRCKVLRTQGGSYPLKRGTRFEENELSEDLRCKH